jgi:hypothetical protein
MRYRTPQALLLEQILAGDGRWLYCWDGEGTEDIFDCGCCLMRYDEEMLTNCPCACHARIDAMASAPGMKFFLTMANEKGLIANLLEYRDRPAPETEPEADGCRYHTSPMARMVDEALNEEKALGSNETVEHKVEVRLDKDDKVWPYCDMCHDPKCPWCYPQNAKNIPGRCTP